MIRRSAYYRQRLVYRWREFICALIGHRWWYGVDRGDGRMDWIPHRIPAEYRWCGRCGRYELNL